MWFTNPNISLGYALLKILASLIVIFLIMPLHEFAHSFVAYKLGDYTAKYAGRLSINPLHHIDPLGAVLILLLGIGWAKPVPIDQRNFKNPKRDTALVALAGPLSNLLAAVLGGLILNATFSGYNLNYNKFSYATETFWSFFIMINIGLAVFNLIPIPPLDGFRILSAFLPNNVLSKYFKYERVASIVLFVLIFIGLLNRPLSTINMNLFRWIINITALPFKTSWFV